MLVKIVKSTKEIPKEVTLKYQKVRAENFYSSRSALLECLSELLQTPNLSIFEDTEIVDHLYLKKYPNLLISISHTKGFGAAAISNIDNCRSIGVDIELIDRKINSDISKYLYNKNDCLSIKDDLLSIWVIKEAAFKAISPLYPKINEKPLVLTDISLRENKFYVEILNIEGTFSIKKKLGLLIGSATLL